MLRTSLANFSIAALATCTLAVPIMAQSPGGAASTTAAPAADRESILQALKDHEALNPGPRPTTRDVEIIADYTAQNNFYITRRAKLIGDLWRAAPDAPELADLMAYRWQNAASLRGVDLTAEIEAFSATHPDATEAVQVGRYTLANLAAMQYRNDAAKAEAAVNEFIAAYPDDPRGASLLFVLARYTEDSTKALDLNRRLAADYPETSQGQAALGQIRKLEAVGKPFELAFTDHLTGKAISMDELRGKVVVIDFWATWCGPCVAEMPNMKKLYAEYKDKGVEFIGISLDQPPDKGGDALLTKYCEENNITWPQYYQGNFWQSEFSTSWGINAIPALFIIDKEGNLHSTEARGQLETLIPELLEK